MSTSIPRQKIAKKKPIIKRELVARPKKQAARVVAAVAEIEEQTTVGKLRSELALTQAQFARLLTVSVRSLATFESGTPLTEQIARRLTELHRLTMGLSEVIKKESLGRWLQTPNTAFGGFKPLEVIERGESDRIWETIYFLRSGVAS
jgi:DNA-binding transcriptional regulator YiaG